MNRFASIACLAAATCMGYAAHAETVERTSAADPRGEVEIVNVAGSVHVTGWDRAEVQVKAELGSGTDRLEFERDGAHTTIHVILRRRSQSEGSDLKIYVPRESRIVTNTVSADQKIEDVHGSQHLQSVSGDIVAQVWTGEFEARTVSGDIAAKGQVEKSSGGKNSSGRTRVNTVSGKVELTDLGDDIELDSVSGDIRLRTPLLTRARVKTTNGDVQVTSALARDGRLDAEAINGDLTFNFQGTIDAEFAVETFNGDIDNCFGPKPKRVREHGPGTELRFKEGEGRARVWIKTLNGGVRLCRK